LVAVVVVLGIVITGVPAALAAVLLVALQQQVVLQHRGKAMLAATQLLPAELLVFISAVAAAVLAVLVGRVDLLLVALVVTVPHLLFQARLLLMPLAAAAVVLATV
jgi:hypothetical protein